MAVRPATAADADALARLRWAFRASLASANEDELAFVARCTAWMSRELSREGGWFAWVAEEDGSIVGMAWTTFVEKIPNPVAEAERHAYVSNVFVVPERRGRGIGASLLDACLGACDAADCDVVFLWPTRESRTLYARHGFAPAGDRLLERRR